MSDTPWWRDAVVYQVYLRSFADGNGDGTGDLPGLISRLDHLVELGVDALWCNPWYASPLSDGGYDVADYRAICAHYGTLEDAETLVREAHARGLRVIADIVPNHSSVEHRWFLEASDAAPGHPSRDRYHIRPGSGPDGDQPPNNWRSVFGGPAWTRLPDGEWYLHLFNASQPDLNWEHPQVRQEFLDVLAFWLDRGIDGFRVDVAHALVKAPGHPDLATPGWSNGPAADQDHPHWDRDGIHTIVRAWRALLDAREAADGRPRMLVAEAWVATQKQLARYLRPDEYHQSFNFRFLQAPWDATALHEEISTAIDAATTVGSTPTWVLSNHDVVRHATRYGLPPDSVPDRWLLDGPHDALDPALGLRRARAAILLMLALPGSAYLYQGEELGLPEAWDLPEDVLDDPIWEQSGHTRKGRDGCRVPIPWSTAAPSCGFGDAPPWLPQPEVFADLSVASQQADPASTLHLYRAALALRREHRLGGERHTWLPAPDGVLAWQASPAVQCHVNLGTAAVPCPPGQLLLASAPTTEQLPADGAVWVHKTATAA